MPTATAAPTAPRTSTTVVTAMSVQVAAVLPLFLFGGLAVQVSGELGMSVSAIGLVSGLYFAVSALTTVPSGRLVDRFGALITARIAVALSAAAMLGIAAFAHHPAVLTAFMILCAPANGLGQLASNTVLTEWAPMGRRGLLFGAKQASVPLCIMLGGLSVPAVALTLGWRWAFVLGAALVLLALIPLAGLGKPAVRPKKADARGFDLRLLLFAAATCLGASAATPIGSFLTTYTVDIGGSERYAGLVLTIGGIAGIIGRTGFGAIADFRKGGEFGIIALMLVGGAAGLATYLFELPWLLPLGTVAAYALGWAWPGLMNHAVTQRYPDAPALATSVTQTGIFLGGAVGPIGFGLLVDHHGWAAGWIATIVAMGLSALFIVAGSLAYKRARH
ncbi:MFS transporter [Glycomyces harbinensis]|uniref:Predicted arabinose efflux permease, MFS family n=1 Tax=Glycomyces harbinensis TaxID=58114 RepID=A0A1G6Z4H0_9ACTN|nr:MFS transporter [Glycomyces harbinensis]SDD97654.1 Predicted arabinose efflux permease, MFS family [Glycomyces harbinensis]